MRGICLWCGHSKALHTGRFRGMLKSLYRHIQWSTTTCDLCVTEVRLCRRYER
jgi:hypothetical protein